MTNNQRGSTAFFIIFAMLFYLVYFLVITVYPIIASIRCEERAGQMEMDYKWTYLGGCLVEYQPGKWIPFEKYNIKER